MKYKCRRASKRDARNITDIIERKLTADKHGISYEELLQIDGPIGSAIDGGDVPQGWVVVKKITKEERQQRRISGIRRFRQNRILCQQKQCPLYLGVKYGNCRYCCASMVEEGQREPIKGCPHCGSYPGGTCGPYNPSGDPILLRCSYLGLSKRDTVYPNDAAEQVIHLFASITRSKYRIWCQSYSKSQLCVP